MPLFLYVFPNTNISSFNSLGQKSNFQSFHPKRLNSGNMVTHTLKSVAKFLTFFQGLVKASISCRLES